MEHILNRIVQGQHYALYGARRSGKTSLALSIKVELEKQGVKVGYIDCGLIASENDLWKMIIKKLKLNYPGEFKNLNYEFAECLENDNYRKLLILDEFELLLNNSSITVNTLNYLRAIANPTMNLTCITISENKLSDLLSRRFEFVGSPLDNIFVEYEVIR